MIVLGHSGPIRSADFQIAKAVARHLSVPPCSEPVGLETAESQLFPTSSTQVA